MYDLLIKNGKLVFSDGIQNGSIAVKDGKIAAILCGCVDAEAKEVIDAGGKYVMPGAIDTHAHLNDPGYEWREDYEHGTAGAIAGGYTTIIDMPLQNEPALTNAELFDIKEEKVTKEAFCDYAFWGGLIPTNFADLKGLDDRGVVAFKSFLGPVSPDYSPLNYGEAYEAMEMLKECGARAGFHAEDFNMIKAREKHMKDAGRLTWRDFLDSRTLAAETVATVAILEIARELDCKAHICHVSDPYVAQKIVYMQNAGVDVTFETCSHYLCFNDEDTATKGELFKCAPPLRPEDHRVAYWDFVRDGKIAGLASDHSPCSYDEKFKEILGQPITNVFEVWGGISGIQNSVQAIISEALKQNVSMTSLVQCMSVNPAKAFGIYGKKGDLKVGFDADINIVDPDYEWEVTEDSLYYVNKVTAFMGLKGKGMPVCTILRGKVMAKEGKLCGDMGYGELVKRIK